MPTEVCDILLYLFLKLCWNAQKVGRLVDRRLILVFGATQGERDRQGFRGWNSLVEACQLNVSVGACNGQLKDYYSTAFGIAHLIFL